MVCLTPKQFWMNIEFQFRLQTLMDFVNSLFAVTIVAKNNSFHDVSMGAGTLTLSIMSLLISLAFLMLYMTRKVIDG